MKRQQKDKIIKFLKENIEPLEDNAYGLGYRASVYLTDGTFFSIRNEFVIFFRNTPPALDGASTGLPYNASRLSLDETLIRSNLTPSILIPKW